MFIQIESWRYSIFKIICLLLVTTSNNWRRFGVGVYADPVTDAPKNRWSEY